MSKTMGLHGKCLLLLTVIGIFRFSNAQDFRLPGTQIPSAYNIHLTFPDEIFNGESSLFSGVVEVTFDTTVSSKAINIHAPGDVKSAKLVLETSPSTPLTIVSRNYDLQTEILTINIEEDLVINSSYQLTLEYEANINVGDRRGIYSSTYTDSLGIRYLINTQFQPTHARKAFPCFDEPKFKANFNLSLTFPSVGYNAYSNKAGSTEPDPDSGPSKTVHFETTPKMSTYLLAFVVSNFTCTWGSSLPNSISHAVCSRPVTQMDRYHANSNAARLIQELESATGISYNDHEIGRLYQIAVPDFYAGAMENWGLPMYRESLLLWNQDHSSNYDSQRVITAISHELAHFWFGNLVTNDWWDNLFLNEGFATYFEYFIPAKIPNFETENNWQMSKQFVIEQLQTALASDGHNSSKALTSSVETPQEISSHFSVISYRKGASVLRMIENFINSATFSNGIKNYLTERKFDTALPTHLWDNIQKGLPAYGLPDTLSVIVETWISKPGYPVVLVSVNGTTINIKQKRFLYDNSTTDDSTQWYVPISYTVASDPLQFSNLSPRTWLIPGSDLEIPNVLQNDEWIIVNNQQGAYYRVNYDDELWNRIKQQLLNDHNKIDVLNRAQIVDDVFNLARAGEIKYTQALSIINYLNEETDYFPWYSAIKGFDFLTNVFGETSETGSKLLDFQHYLLQNVYNVATFQSVNGSDQIHTFRLSLILNRLCRVGEMNCIFYARQYYQNYRNGNGLDKNLKSVVYCNGIRYSSDLAADWTYLWSQLQQTDVASERREIIAGLGCARNAIVLNTYLVQAMEPSSGLRLQDFAAVWSSVYSSGTFGLELALIFFTENHEQISSYYSDANYILSNIAARISTEDQLSHLKGFLSSSSLPAEVSWKAIADATANLEWCQRRKTEIDEFFAENPIPDTTYPTTPTTTTTTTTSTTTPTTTTTQITSTTPTTTTTPSATTTTPMVTTAQTASPEPPVTTSSSSSTTQSTTTTPTTTIIPSTITTTPMVTTAQTASPEPPVTTSSSSSSSLSTTTDPNNEETATKSTAPPENDESAPGRGQSRTVSAFLLTTMLTIAFTYLMIC